MSNEIESDIRTKVNDCFTHRGYMHDGETPTQSAYQMLTDVLKEYGLDHWDGDSLANTIEHVVAEYIMDYSPKLNDNEND